MADIKKVILQTKLEGTLHDLLLQINAQNVEYTTGEGTTTTVAAQIAAMLATIATLPTTENVTEQVAALEQKLLGDLPKEALDTFTELANAYEEHQEVADALQAAIGNKLDTSVFDEFKATLGALATKSTVSESDLDAALAEKVNAAAAGNHSHANKTELDKVAEGDVERWNTAATKVGAWNGSNFFVGTEAPAEMQDGDVLFKIVE